MSAVSYTIRVFDLLTAGDNYTRVAWRDWLSEPRLHKNLPRTRVEQTRLDEHMATARMVVPYGSSAHRVFGELVMRDTGMQRLPNWQNLVAALGGLAFAAEVDGMDAFTDLLKIAKPKKLPAGYGA